MDDNMLNRAPSPVDTTPKPTLLAYYRSTYDREYAHYGDEFARMAAAGNGEDRNYYTLQYALMGALSLYEASGDRRYLYQALSWARAEMATCTLVDAFGDCNWSGTWQPVSFDAPDKIAYQLDDVQGMTQLARLAYLILTRPALADLRAQGIDIYRFVKAQWLTKWLDHRDSWQWFYADMKDEAKAIDDKTLMLGEIMAYMARASAAQPSEWKDGVRMTSYASQLARGLLDHDGGKPRFSPQGSGLGMDIGVTWSDDGDCGATAIDTAHANRYPAAMMTFHETGFTFDRSMLRGIAAGFVGTIWNGSLSSPAFSNYSNGDNRCFRERPPWGNGAIYFGWNQLAQYSWPMLHVVDATLRQIDAGTSNPSLDYNGSSFGIIALAGGLAKAVALGDYGPAH
ncbi:hypothetical protein [Paludibacterium yongneupense]|uniref:hypothetical protein n=2 Tax=Paludibacterium yongneupense TaxID=400061 RepID=UPI00049128B5|nr:hypothetical protein [Paludibacterium yongneupense]